MSHWYDWAGNPCYEQAKKDGGLRPTTLADARKQNLVGSVTTYLDVIKDPWLIPYKENQAILAARTLPMLPGEVEDDYVKRVRVDAAEHSKAAMELGTRCHSALEAYWTDGTEPEAELLPIVEPAINAVDAMNLDNLRAEVRFAHPLGYGGTVDLVGLDGEGRAVVIDYKTTGAKMKLCAKDKDGAQLAAYARGLGLAPARLINIYIHTERLGDILCHEWENQDRLLRIFDRAMGLWCDLNNYYPRRDA